MREPTRTRSYNSRNPRMCSHPIRRSIFLVLILAFCSCLANAQNNWQEMEKQLAAKIAAVTGSRPISFDLVNRSSLAHSQEAEIRRVLIQELAAAGLQSATTGTTTTAVHISLSENAQNYVWVAQIIQEKIEPAVVMVSFPQDSLSHASGTAPTISLRRTLLWTQNERILDAAIVSGNPQQFILLDANGVGIYQMQGGHWQLQQELPIAHSRPWPRDLRGHIFLRKDHFFDIYLPGAFCHGVSGTPMSLNCDEGENPWPIGSGGTTLNAFFAPERNFFTGALAPRVSAQTSLSPFFSAAALPRDHSAFWFFAAVDGSVHLLDGSTDQLLKEDWGSDITALHSGCASQWQLLATSKSTNGNDSIRVFDVPDREPFSVGQPTEFHGSIVGLWAQSDGSSATAVVQAPEPGGYEAYQLNLACD